MFLISGFVTINHIISYPKAFSVFTVGVVTSCISDSYTQNFLHMKEKDMYVSPNCETLELCTQGVIAQSPGDFANPAFFMPFDPEEEELEW